MLGCFVNFLFSASKNIHTRGVQAMMNIGGSGGLARINFGMTLEEKKHELLRELLGIENPQERFAFLVRGGRARQPLLEAQKTENHRIHGCVARLWFVAEIREGRCRFTCDSDSMVIKGIAGLLCDFYSGAAPSEILALPPDFLKEAGITQHLSHNRSNALTRVWERIELFAREHLGAALVADEPL